MVEVTFDPETHKVALVQGPYGVTDDLHVNGIGMEVNGEPCEHLTSASRYVFLHRSTGTVIKVAREISRASQCWIEFLTYHEVLDDEARALVPTVRGFGMVDFNRQVWCWNAMDYVPTFRKGSRGRGMSKPMRKWRRHARTILEHKYGLWDLHEDNLAFTSDGVLTLVDLGISTSFHGMGSPTSEVVCRTLRGLKPEHASLLGVAFPARTTHER